MNITTAQLQSIRSVLSKQDKAVIAEQAGKSPRTVEAVLQGDRVNDEIERLAVKQAKINILRLQKIISSVDAKNNHAVLLIEEYKKLRKNPPTTGEDYNRFMDIYLDLVHVKFNDCEALWEHLCLIYPDVIQYPYWCILLFVRLLGISEEQAVAFHNSKK